MFRYILGGSTNGTVVCCELADAAELTTHGVFHTGLGDRGHEGVVRSAVLVGRWLWSLVMLIDMLQDTTRGTVFTGGEDGAVVSWGPNAGESRPELKDVSLCACVLIRTCLTWQTRKGPRGVAASPY